MIAEGAQGRRSAVTGPDGGCTLELPAGTYTLAVDLPGFVLSQPEVTLGDEDVLARRGITLREERGVTPPTCERILEDYSAHE